MAGRPEVTFSEVRLWGASVGLVAWDPALGYAAFEYAPAFLETGIELAPVMMPLSPGAFAFPSLNRETFRGLPGMLADSLPDKFGNSLIDQWLAESGRAPATFNPVQRLMYVGQRGMGALEYHPVIEQEQPATISLNIEELVALSSKVLALRESERFRLDPQDAAGNVAGLGKILAVGTSAGGARAKAIIAWNEATGDVRSGQIDAGPGYSYWLLKFDGVSNNRDKELADPKGYGRIEYAYHMMAVEAGIEMTRCRLLEENGRAHFMTRRFDRTDDGHKLHMQTLCALGHHDFNVPGSTSYEQAFLLCDQLGLGMVAREQLFLRMVFNVVAYNRDDHTKQIAFLMNKAGEWRLGPAYDVTYAFNPHGDYTSRHQMSVNRKREAIVDEDFLAVARRQGVNRALAKRAIARVREAVANWPRYAQRAAVSDAQAAKIAGLLGSP
ncbi:MAG: type II toxin-antitoxin system HipA family toxin [Halioglobus sp.]